MAPSHILTILSLLLLSGVPVLSQDYETNNLDYDTEDSSPEDPLLSIPQQPDYDGQLMYWYECASECSCPPSYPFAMYCDSRKLTAVPNIPGHIRHLYIQHNDIEEITSKPFINATSLREINLSYNKLQSSKLDKDVFSILKELIQLHLEHNNLEDIPSPLPKTLKRLHLGFNKISKIPADATRELTKLTVLDLCSNRLTDAGIKGKILSDMKSLTQINMCNNKLKSMPADLPESIQQISLENNSISSIPAGYFKKTPNLLSLRMPHNKLKSVAYNAFNLSKLMELHLGHNQLFKPFFVPRTLEHLYLNHNDFKDLNISVMCPSLDLANPNMLTYIRLDNNKLTGPVDYYAYRCFPRLVMIFYGIQRKDDEEDSETKKYEKPNRPKRPGGNKAIN
ncbi:osteomodulin-like [Carassius carassius]|uniref:osteomodulin-like n=1 Tax=Carassius carassius TaxID=217509 RepID=UPI002868D6B7|nr:osteomodulin-like [Carassius carassius]XP_059399533.1 osteomodulin-like [Carassius carassius]